MSHEASVASRPREDSSTGAIVCVNSLKAQCFKASNLPHGLVFLPTFANVVIRCQRNRMKTHSGHLALCMLAQSRWKITSKPSACLTNREVTHQETTFN